MNTCYTCKHWALIPLARVIRRGDHVHAWRRCSNPKVNYVEQFVMRSRLSTVPDDCAGPLFVTDDDLGSALMTGPKFGCIHHEDRLVTPAAQE